MPIDRLELRVVSLPLVRPFATSHGTLKRRTVLLVRVGDGQLAGWGECGAFTNPYYLPETIDTARHIIEKFIAPTVLDSPVAQALEGAERVRGNLAARAAVEQAVTDLAARQSGFTLAEHIGGSLRQVAVGAVASVQDLPFLEQEVADYIASGYQRIKLKIHPGHDVKPVRMVRSNWPDVTLAVDANGSYDRTTAEHLEELDTFDLQFIEQPLRAEDLAGHAALSSRMSTPICLDESIAGIRDLEWAIRLRAADVVNVKPARVGGVAVARAMGELVEEHGLSAWVGGMLETGIGRAHALALATLPWFDRAADLSASGRYFERDLIEPPWSIHDGTLTPRREPGIGVEPELSRLEEATVSMQVIAR